jgi:tRNA pseudouridine55 synthase
LNGLLVVDKPGIEETPPGVRLPSSHDIVNRLRRWSGQKRIGHTGTLDPMASGVMVMTLGYATKLTEYYQGQDKAYLAEIKLGQATDTYDVTGKVTVQAETPAFTPAVIEQALGRFRGTIDQVPPSFSAIKQGGATAYKRARRGKPLALPPRQVTFYRIELEQFQPSDQFTLAVSCSSGAYIRSLAHDLGLALGAFAHLYRLRRTAVGEFSLVQAHSLSEIEQAAQQGRLQELLLPAGQGLLLPTIELSEEGIRKLGFGQQVEIPCQKIRCAAPAPSVIGLAYRANGELAGLVRCLRLLDKERSLWRAEKWFQDHADHLRSS